MYKRQSYDGTSFNFYPWMTKAGTYSFKVRAVPKTGDDYASKSSWTESDEIYIAQEDVSDGSGQVDPGSAGNLSLIHISGFPRRSTSYRRATSSAWTPASFTRDTTPTQPEPTGSGKSPLRPGN